MRVIVALLMCLGLAACQMTLPGFGGKSATPPAQAPAAPAGVTAKPGAIMGSAVAVTPIRPGTPAAPPAAQTAAVPKAVTPLPAATPAAAASHVAAPVVAPAAPPAPKSEAQLACEKQKGRWTEAGGERMACVFQTRDGGKSCRKETDCDGLCLARSGTCAPIKPLFGCNAILQADGRQVTLCID